MFDPNKFKTNVVRAFVTFLIAIAPGGSIIRGQTEERQFTGLPTWLAPTGGYKPMRSGDAITGGVIRESSAKLVLNSRTGSVTVEIRKAADLNITYTKCSFNELTVISLEGHLDPKTRRIAGTGRSSEARRYTIRDAADRSKCPGDVVYPIYDWWAEFEDEKTLAIYWNLKYPEKSVNFARVSTSGDGATKVTATIGAIKGEVVFSRYGSEYHPVIPGQELLVGDSVMTSADSEVVLNFHDGARMTLREMTDVSIGELATSGGRARVVMQMKLGEVNATVKRQRTVQSDFSIKTPTATASVRGTIFTVTHDEKSTLTTVSVEEGEVTVAPINAGERSITVLAGQRVFIDRNNISRTPPPTVNTAKTLTTPKVEQVSTAQFIGKWDVGEIFGIMSLSQTGTEVKGSFSDGGSIQGIATENMLRFSWRNGKAESGEGTLSLAPSRTLELRWCRGKACDPDRGVTVVMRY